MSTSNESLRNKVIRIFISSTFEDMRKERDILQQKVYPYLLSLCAPRGWQIEFVDLRWGISKEAGVQQKTMRICLEELRRCRKVSPRPNFLILQGQRYGWCPLPETIAQQHWAPLVALAKERGVYDLLVTWYRYDANGVPPIYELRGKDDFPEKEYDKDFVRYEQEVESPLHELMVAYANSQDDMNPMERSRFVASATEQEINNGALSDEVLPQQVAAYIRTVTDLDYNAEYQPLLDDKPVRERCMESIDLLKQRIRQQLSSVDEAVTYRDLTYAEYTSPDYCQVAEEDLKTLLGGLVKREMDEYERAKWSPWDIEIYRQNAFVELRTRHFHGRETILAEFARFVQSDGRLFCLEGRSGTGKSSVMAKVFSLLRNEKQYIAIFRSVGEGSSTSGQAILRTVFQELRENCHIDIGDGDLDKMSYAELSEKSNHLMHTYEGRKIVLMIDAIDQLPMSDPMRSFDWLPLNAKGNVCVIVSRIADSDSNRLPTEMVMVLDDMSSEGVDHARKILMDNLRDVGRTLTLQQQDVVLQAYANGGSRPIYLKLIAGIAASWRSDDVVRIDDESGYTEASEDGHRIITIPTGEAELVAGFFRLMATPVRHAQIVINVLSLILLTRRGMSDGEIRQLLALDEDFMDIFRKNSFHDFKPVVDAFPSIIWTRLYYDIKFLLSEHVVTGGAVNNFNHRQVHEGARLFLEEHSYNPDRTFRLLMSYFGERYRLKDMRALEELPRVLKKSGRLEELATLLLDIDFIQSKAANGLIFDLVDDLHVAIRELNSRFDPLTAEDIDAILYPHRYSQQHEELLNRAVLERQHNRLQAVSEYVVQELAQFIDFSVENKLFTLQLFYNAYANGPLSQMAEAYREASGSTLPEMYLRINRPEYVEHPLVIRKLVGHSWCITSLAVSYDGEIVVTASDDKLCKVWDVTHSRVLRTFFGHQTQVGALAVDNDFKKAYSGSWDGQVLCWNIDSALEREPAYTPPAISNVIALVVDPDGGCRAGYRDGHCRHIVYGRELSDHVFDAAVTALSVIDGRIYAGMDNGDIYDVSTEPYPVSQLGTGIRTIAKHGDFLWVSTAEGLLFEVDTMTGISRQLMAFNKPEKVNPTDFRFSVLPDNSMLAVIVDTTIVMVENPANCNCKFHTLKEHSKDINAVQLLPDGKRLFSAGRDRRLTQWNLENLNSANDHHVSLSYRRWFDKLVLMSKQTSRMDVVAASCNGRVVKWSSKESVGTPLAEGMGPVYAFDVSIDGHTSMCATGNSDPKYVDLHIVDLDNPADRVTLPRVHNTYINAVRFSPNGRFAVSNAIDRDGSGEGEVLVLWDISQRKAIRVYSEPSITGHLPYCSGETTSDPGIHPVTGRYKASRISDVETLGHIIHINSADGVSWSPCGRMVAVACRDCNVALFDPFNGRIVRLLGRESKQCDNRCHRSEVKSVAFSPDGRWLFSGSWDNSVIVWDLFRPAGAEFTIRLCGHTRGIYSIDVAPDGKTMVSGANDRSFIIWDINRAFSLAEQGRLEANYRDGVIINRVVTSANCDAVAFTRDGVIAGLDDGDVVVTENSNGETLRDIPVVTASSENGICCPCCGSRFGVPNALKARIEESNIAPYPSLNQHRPNINNMLTTCPRCHNNMYLNPFMV